MSHIIRFGSKTEFAIYTSMRLLALIDLWFVPFIMSFDSVYPLRREMGVFVFEVATSTIFGVGVLTRLRTSFFSARESAECKDPERIRHATVRRWDFHADCVSLLSFPLLYMRGPLAPLGVLKLLKIWRLPRSMKRVMLLEYHKTNVFAQLIQIVIGVFAASHMLACIWFIAKVNSPPGEGKEWSAWNGWSADVMETADADVGALSVAIEPGGWTMLWLSYGRALRDGVYMLIGWAGPNAISPVELVTICVMGPLSGCTMAYVYGLFVASIQQAWVLEGRFSERTSVLAAACRDMHLPPGLASRVCRYHSYLSVHHLGLDAQELFAQLSPNIMLEMRMFRMREAILEASIFQGLPSRVILLLVQTCTEQIFSPGDIIVRKGELAECMYIILRGTTSVLNDDDATRCVNKMYERDCFGEICLLKGRIERTAWVRAETFVVLWRLDKDRFDAVLDGCFDMKFTVFRSILKKMGNYAGLEELKKQYEKVNVPEAEEYKRSRGSLGGVELRRPSAPEVTADEGGIEGSGEGSEEWDGKDSNEMTPLMSTRPEFDSDDDKEAGHDSVSPLRSNTPARRSMVHGDAAPARRRASISLNGPAAEAMRRPSVRPVLYRSTSSNQSDGNRAASWSCAITPASPQNSQMRGRRRSVGDFSAGAHAELCKELVPHVSPSQSGGDNSLAGTHVDLFQDHYQRQPLQDETPQCVPDRAWERLQMQIADFQGHLEAQGDASERREWRAAAELDTVKAQLAAVRGDLASQRDVAMRLEVQVGLLAGQLHRIEDLLVAPGRGCAPHLPEAQAAVGEARETVQVAPPSAEGPHEPDRIRRGSGSRSRSAG